MGRTVWVVCQFKEVEALPYAHHALYEERQLS